MSKHNVTIGRVEFVLDHCEGQWSWFSLPNGIAPACVDCGETLTPRCDDDSTDVSVERRQDDANYVTCDNCRATWPIDDAPALPKAGTDEWAGTCLERPRS